MTQPRSYDRSRTFVDSDTGTTYPVPASMLDTEFALVEQTLDDVCTNLGLLQRDDGALKNRIVTPESLSATTTALLGSWTPQGDWEAGHNYAALDYVSHLGSSWVAIDAHTSTSNFSTDRAAGHWQILDLAPTNALPSPELFGAAGDGVTDDTTALQRALTAGPVSLLPGRTYAISSKVTVTGILEGNGAIIRATAATFNLVKISGTAGVRIRNVVFQGAATGSSTTQFAIETDAVTVPSDFQITGNTFGHASYQLNSGVFLQGYGETSFIIAGNVFQRLVGIISGVGYGVLVGAASRGVIADNIGIGIRGTHGRHLVYVSAGATDLVVKSNIAYAFNFEAFTALASGVQPSNKRIIFSKNIGILCGADNENSGTFWVGGKGEDITFRGNKSYQSYGNGFMVDNYSTTAGLTAIVLDGNSAIDSYYQGIHSLGPVEQAIGSNFVKGSSRKAAQTYFDILIGATGTGSLTNQPTHTLLTFNQCVPVAGVSRAPLSVATTGATIKCFGNNFPTTDFFTGPLYNNALNTVWIEGRLQYLQNTVAVGGTNTLTCSAPATVTVLGARVGDKVLVNHEQSPSRWAWDGVVTANDTVVYWGFNQHSGSQSVTSGTLRIDVLKRDGSGL